MANRNDSDSNPAAEEQAASQRGTGVPERDLLEATMAASALVAMADRRLRIEESVTLGALVDYSELLRIHDPAAAVDLYARYVDRLRSDYEAGKRDAFAAIAKCSGDLAAAELLVRVAIAIAKADDEFCQEELAMVEEICALVGIAGLDPLALAGSLRADRPLRPH